MRIKSTKSMVTGTVGAILLGSAIHVWWFSQEPSPAGSAAPVSPEVTASLGDGSGTRLETAVMPHRPVKTSADHRRRFPSGVRRTAATSRLGCGLRLRVEAREDGAPIEGAVAEASFSGEGLFQSEPTASDGSTFLDVPCGSQSITVSRAGFTQQRFQTNLTPADIFLCRTVSLYRAYIRIGKVLDESGEPLADAVASVVAIDRPGERPRRARTGKAGAFQIELTDGQQRLSVGKHGFESYSAIVGPDEPWVETITLAPIGAGSRFSGVVHASSGQPISEAYLVLRQDSQRRTTGAGSTDRNGRFDFATTAEGPCRLTVSARGCLDFVGSVDPSKTTDFRLTLDCFRTFKVTVLDLSGEPVEDPFIEGVSPSTGERLVNCWGGGVCYAAAYPVRIQAAAFRYGIGISPPLLLSEYAAEVVLRMEMSGGLVVVLDDSRGSPLKAFSIGVRKPLSMSAHFQVEDGTLCLESLPEGEYEMVFAAAGFRPAMRTVRVMRGRVARLHLTMQPLQERARDAIAGRDQ